MSDVEISKIVVGEWLKTEMITEVALGSKCESDSHGSMLTRAALILLYAMLDAQLSVVSQVFLYGNQLSFEPAEISFLSEVAVGVDTEGDLTFSEGHQQFKQRIVGVPRVLARRVSGLEIALELGDAAGQALLAYKDLRDRVIHPRIGEDPPRVSKEELRSAHNAVRAYFGKLVTAAPEVFGHYEIFLRS